MCASRPHAGGCGTGRGAVLPGGRCNPRDVPAGRRSHFLRHVLEEHVRRWGWWEGHLLLGGRYSGTGRPTCSNGVCLRHSVPIEWSHFCTGCSPQCRDPSVTTDEGQDQPNVCNTVTPNRTSKAERTTVGAVEVTRGHPSSGDKGATTPASSTVAVGPATPTEQPALVEAAAPAKSAA